MQTRLPSKRPSNLPRETAATRLPFVIIPQEFGSLVFERQSCRYFPFDREATHLLVELVSETINTVMERTEERSRREAIARFYDELYDRGFFTLDGQFAAQVLEVDVPAGHLSGPLAVHLEISEACNLKCHHCFADDPLQRGHPLGLSDLNRLFLQMSQMGCYRLGLTGGEPLLRRDLFDIIDLALAHGLSPCVTTNGLLIDEATAEEFGRRALLWLNVSLEGALPATNDLIRGQGSFSRVMENLKALARHTRFSLAFTVMRTNLREIEECAELARRVGAQSAVFRPLYPVGAAQEHMELMPSFAEYTAALKVLGDLEKPSREDDCSMISFSPASRRLVDSLVYWDHGCGAGNLVCSISYSGDLSSCSFLGPGFVVGNVRERSLPDLWRAAAFERFRKPCTCQDGALLGFAGGCRARALWLNGSVDAADPWIGDCISGALNKSN